jgi:2-succinyl-5-enolpyruvyl-6-hydroxy-3-cyclohexene-1-carboxylate synthase
MIFEVFTDSQDESDALEAISRIMEPPMSMKEALKDTVKKAMGEKAVKAIKKLMGR